MQRAPAAFALGLAPALTTPAKRRLRPHFVRAVHHFNGKTFRRVRTPRLGQAPLGLLDHQSAQIKMTDRNVSTIFPFPQTPPIIV